jgi:hypothetical protein
VIDLCVSGDLDSYKDFVLVIEGLDDLSKRTFSKNSFDLVPVGEVVVYEHVVVALLVIQVLEDLLVLDCSHVLGSPVSAETQEEDLVGLL